MVGVGPAKATSNTMTTPNNGDNWEGKRRLEQVIELLKFALSLDDEEIVKSTVESVIEILEEEIAK